MKFKFDTNARVELEVEAKNEDDAVEFFKDAIAHSRVDITVDSYQPGKKLMGEK